MEEKEAVLQILGMHCPTCAQRIESGLSKVDGVIEVKVNFVSKEAIVRFDLDRINVEEIKGVIKRVGYEAVEGEDP
ncbi:MAG: cation transporter [Candidatus Bathyarchaeales archaeon]